MKAKALRKAEGPNRAKALQKVEGVFRAEEAWKAAAGPPYLDGLSTEGVDSFVPSLSLDPL